MGVLPLDDPSYSSSVTVRDPEVRDGTAATRGCRWGFVGRGVLGLRGFRVLVPCDRRGAVLWGFWTEVDRAGRGGRGSYGAWLTLVGVRFGFGLVFSFFRVDKQR